MRRLLMLTATAVLTLSSCSNDTEIGNPNENNGSNAISFRSFIDKGGETRATITDGGNILGFTITGWWDKKKPAGDPAIGSANPEEGGYLFNAFDITRREEVMNLWDYDPKIYWPTVGNGVYFFSYSPASSKNVDKNGDGKGLYNYKKSTLIDYTVPDPGEDESQEDFLLARTGVLTQSPVTLNFAHALSRVTFSASKGDSKLTYLIDEVALVNIKKNGTIDLIDIPTTGSFTYTSTGATVVHWDTSTAATESISLDLGESQIYVQETQTSILGPTNALMVMPQITDYVENPKENATGFMVKVSYKAFIEAGDPGTYYAGSPSAFKTVYFAVSDVARTTALNDGSTVPFTFEIGRQYNFYLTFGAEAAGEITFDAEVGSWSDVIPGKELPETNFWFDGLISEKIAAAVNSSYKTEGVTQKQIEAVTTTQMVIKDVDKEEDLKGLEYFVNMESLNIEVAANNLNIVLPKIPLRVLQIGPDMSFLSLEERWAIDWTLAKLDLTQLKETLMRVNITTQGDRDWKFGKLTITEARLWDGFTTAYGDFFKTITGNENNTAKLEITNLYVGETSKGKVDEFSLSIF